MDITFYYFSGTGNSKRVTEWVFDEAQRMGAGVANRDVAHKRESPEEPSPDDMIGFIAPTHGFNYPPVMMYFIFRFPRTRFKNKVFLMNTRGGLKLSKIFLPGLSGIAFWLAAIVLLLKGYRIVAMRSIDLPSNWISLHPGIRANVAESMFRHYEKVTRKFTRKIIMGKKVFRFSLLLGIPLDILIAPIALGYYVVGRFILAKTFMASQACDNCGLCIKHCPVKAISLVDNRPYWSYRCESCMRCMNNCPKRAIETAHGFLIFTVIMINSVLLAGLYSVFPIGKWPLAGSFLSTMIRVTVEWLIALGVILFTYRLVHFLKRFRWFDYVITYTSLTKIKFWRRYKPRA